MTIGELAIDLGIKGNEKTLGAITGVKQGLKDTASVSLEAKAAIVGAMYALERLFAASGATGTSLTNFNSLLGVSTKTLQQYQFAARQMGVTNEETAGTFKSLQSAMTKTLMGEGAPKGLARVGLLTGGVGPQDIKDFQQNPALLFQRLQQYAMKEANQGLRNEVLKSFGLSDGMISAMVRGAFRPDVLAKAPTYGEGEISALNRANIAWSNLGNTIEMAVGHFNAKHGLQLVSEISKLTSQILQLADAFVTLSEKIKLFEGIGRIFKGWNEIFKSLTSVVSRLNQTSGPSTFSDKLLGLKNTASDVGGVGKQVFSDWLDRIKVGDYRALLGPSLLAEPTGAPQSINHNVNQHLHFQHEGKDHNLTSDSVKKSIQSYYRQNAAQGQGS